MLVDGVDVREMRQEDLRAKIGYVSQRGDALFRHHREQYPVRRRSATIADVEHAATTAQATEFIDQLDRRYEARDRPGRRECLRRAEATARDCARDRPATRDLHFRRQLFRARLSHGRDAAGGARSRDRKIAPCSSSPSASARSCRPKRSSCSMPVRLSGKAGTRSCCAHLRGLPRNRCLATLRSELEHRRPPGVASLTPGGTRVRHRHECPTTRRRAARPAGPPMLFGRAPGAMMADQPKSRRDFRRTIQRLVGYLRPFWASLCWCSSSRSRARSSRSSVRASLANITNMIVSGYTQERVYDQFIAELAAGNRDSAGNDRRRNCSPSCRRTRSSRFRSHNDPRSRRWTCPAARHRLRRHRAPDRAPDRALRAQRRLRLRAGLDDGRRVAAGHVRSAPRHLAKRSIACRCATSIPAPTARC